MRYLKQEQNYTQSQVQISNLNGQNKSLSDTPSTILTLSFFFFHQFFSYALSSKCFFSGRRHLSEWLVNSINSARRVLATTKYPNCPSYEPPKDWAFVCTHASGKHCEHLMQNQLLCNQKKGVMCSTISQLLLPLSSHFLPIYFSCCL